MAQRRMFSQKIVGSDAFIEMPVSARELYFQLGMYADDDGFINPKKIVRMIGASDDDLKILCGKRFALPFENGVVVIKHWKINNMIRKDFYEPTIYAEELKSLTLKENKAYTDNCQQNVNNLSPQYSIGKDSIDKISIERAVNTHSLEEDFFNNNNSEHRSSLLEELIDRGLDESTAAAEITKFISYWTEPNRSGKPRWKLEKTFEIRRRLAFWISRVNLFNKTKTTPIV